jgi:hypothetical protein
MWDLITQMTRVWTLLPFVQRLRRSQSVFSIVTNTQQSLSAYSVGDDRCVDCCVAAWRFIVLVCHASSASAVDDCRAIADDIYGIVRTAFADGHSTHCATRAAQTGCPSQTCGPNKVSGSTQAQ